MSTTTSCDEPVPEGFHLSSSTRREGKSVATSSGVIIGRVHKLLHGRQPIPVLTIAHDQLEHEADRLLAAIDAAVSDIDIERHHLHQAGAKEPLMILDMHRMLIIDPELLNKSIGRIQNDCINAEWALRQEIDAIQDIFEQVEDEYLRHRKHDIEHAGRRILKHFAASQQLKSQDIDADISAVHPHIASQLIYVGDDFSVTDIVSMWRQGVAGVITEQGGADAHNIIVARGVGLPTLVGATGILSDIEDGETLILDAEQGTWILNPSPNEQISYLKFINAIAICKQNLQAFAGKPSLSWVSPRCVRQR